MLRVLSGSQLQLVTRDALSALRPAVNHIGHAAALYGLAELCAWAVDCTLCCAVHCTLLCCLQVRTLKPSEDPLNGTQIYWACDSLCCAISAVQALHKSQRVGFSLSRPARAACTPSFPYCSVLLQVRPLKPNEDPLKGTQIYVILASVITVMLCYAVLCCAAAGASPEAK
jgi:hypothetical protein